MSDAFELKTVAQVRAFHAPATLDVYSAMQAVCRLHPGGVSARELAQQTGLSPETVHYHLRKLVRLGIATETAQRRSGARPEKLFGLRHRGVEFRRSARTRAYLRAMVRGVRLMLGGTLRTYETAVLSGEARQTSPRVTRLGGWLSKRDARRLLELERQITELFERANETSADTGTDGRERIIMVTLVTPTA